MTDESSSSYIPAEDRIATFDMDGTLFGELFPAYFDWCMFVYCVLEDKTFNASDEMKEVAELIKGGMETRNMSEEAEERHAIYAPLAYKGMTVDECKEYVRDFMKHKAEGFDGMTYGEAFYKPMISLVQYLAENDFKVYICSGTDRVCVRTQIEGVLDAYIPPERVIGSDNTLVASGQKNEDGMEYVYNKSDEVVLGGESIVKNIKMNKVSIIAQEIGKQPVLAFGNSSGDISIPYP